MFPIFRDHAEPEAPLLFTSGPAFGEAIGILEEEANEYGPDDRRNPAFAKLTRPAALSDCPNVFRF